MGGVQKGDMESSRKVLFKEDDDTSSSRSHTSDKSDQNGGQEPTTPPTAQRPLVSHELGSSNYKYLDTNYTWSAQDNNAPPTAYVVVDVNDGEEEEKEEDQEEKEESDNDATARPSTEGDWPDIGAPTQESMGNTSSDPSNNDDGVEIHELISSTSESEENQHFIPRYSKKEKGGSIPENVILYRAASMGDWTTAKSIFDIDPSAITKAITVAEDTPLHIAVFANHISFVEKLVQLCSSSDLEAQNENGLTALAFAATSGAIRIAKVLVDKNPDLPNLGDVSRRTPVLMAVLYKQKDMASYLFSKTNFEALHTSQQLDLLISTITTDYYDIALDILIKKPELAKERMEENYDTALHVLARKPSVIGSSNELSFWKRHINTRFKGIYKKALMQTLAHQVVQRIWNVVVEDLSTLEIHRFIRNPSRLLHEAARVGNVELLIILIRSYPDLLWKVNEDDKSIFHVAVENRQESVFSLIYEIGGMKDFIANYTDRTNNFNILHLAGMVASQNNLNRVSGAALQMQREILWFKEVEKIVIPSHHEMRCRPLPEISTVEIIRKDDDDGLTPRELFTKEHKQLLKDGEEWMKNTANSCMLVATLIATVVFAAAFTVPGGNDGKDGIPIFRQNQAFTVFVISDVAALVMSTTSILTFLSILTSRYAEEDFLMSLPIKLLFGLMTLFVSIACMVVAFSATFFIAYDKTKAKIPLVIAAVTILPIGCFCVFHFKLVVDILRSSYWPRFSLRKRKKRLF